MAFPTRTIVSSINFNNYVLKPKSIILMAYLTLKLTLTIMY